MDSIGYYSSIAHSYEALYMQEQLTKIKEIVSIIKPASSWELLDIGAGTGLLEEELKNFKITALEPSELADLLAAKNLPNVEIVRKKVSEFRTKKRFDAVFCITVLQDLDEKERAACIKLAFHSCKKGGKIAISLLERSNIDLSYLKPESSGEAANDRFYVFTK